MCQWNVLRSLSSFLKSSLFLPSQARSPLSFSPVELPLSVVEGADVTGLEPSRDAVEVECVLDRERGTMWRRLWSASGTELIIWQWQWQWSRRESVSVW